VQLPLHAASPILCHKLSDCLHDRNIGPCTTWSVSACISTIILVLRIWPGCWVAGRFAPLTFRPLDVSPLHWTFRLLDVSPPGRFAHSLDVSPPTVDVSPPSAFLCLLFFITPERDGRVDTGQTEFLSISRISVVTRDKDENENYYHTFSANENRKILATLSLNLGLGLRTTNFVGLTIVRSQRMC